MIRETDMYKGSVGSSSFGSDVYPWLPNGREDVPGLLKCCSKLPEQSMGGTRVPGYYKYWGYMELQIPVIFP